MQALFHDLAQFPVFFLVCLTILGLLIGSFLNVVILRLPPRMEWAWRQEAQAFLDLPGSDDPKPLGLVVESSRCPKCGHQLSWWENLPLVSYLLLRGKCRGCKTSISWQYPLVEAITAGLFLACGLAFGPSYYLFASLVFMGLLVAAAGIDFRTTLLPDSLVYPILWLGLAVAALGVPGAITPAQAIFGGLLGYLSLWSVYWLFKLLTGKDGMGHGDFKLLAALGAWCGPESLLSIVLISTVVGALMGGIAMAIQGRDRATQFPFGPYLAMGGLIEFFWRGGLLGLLTGA